MANDTCEIDYNEKRGGYHFTDLQGHVQYYEQPKCPGHFTSFAMCMGDAADQHGLKQVTISDRARHRVKRSFEEDPNLNDL